MRNFWIELQYRLRLQKLLTYRAIRNIVLATSALLSLTTMFMLMIDDTLPELSRFVMLVICNITMSICVYGLLKKED